MRIFGTVQDITERKQAEKAKSDFIANAAHELRTPLTTMAGVAEILAGFRRSLTEEQLDDHCEIIRRQGDRARRLIKGLLDLSGMEQGLLRIDPQPVVLSGAVRRAVDAVPAPPGRSVGFDVPDGLTVLADPMRLEEVLVNLLANAYRYGGQAVEISAANSGPAVRVSVSDDGDGVPDELIPSLFQPFSRGTKHQATEGSGLGLAISRRLVEAMEGTLSYEPAAERGARFVLRLRRAT